MVQTDRQTDRSLRTELQKRTRQIKESVAEKAKEKWRRKRMHGQYPRSLDEKLVDNEQSYRWLKFENIKGETESTIGAAQGRAISTNYFKNKILKQEVDSKCRLCKQHVETIGRLISGCPILAKN
jgi:IS30 family transposase